MNVCSTGMYVFARVYASVRADYTQWNYNQNSFTPYYVENNQTRAFGVYYTILVISSNSI